MLGSNLTRRNNKKGKWKRMVKESQRNIEELILGQ